MHLNLSADEVLSTTRAVRKRLDLERPVEREVLEECLQLAIQAPSGSNRQSWHFVLVGDAERKEKLAALYRETFEEFYNAGRSAEYPEGDPRAERKPKVQESAAHLTENFHRVPWILIPCAEGRGFDLPRERQPGWYGSIIPAVWSFMLAARERGLGTAWTTMHLAREKEAAEILGIPYDTVAQVAMIPIAYTIGTDFKQASRLSLDTIAHWETW
jgi:nitroreductase